MTLADDEALFEAAWRVLKPERINEGRLLLVENTLHLEELWLSEVLLEEVEAQRTSKPSVSRSLWSSPPEVIWYGKSTHITL